MFPFIPTSIPSWQPLHCYSFWHIDHFCYFQKLCWHLFLPDNLFSSLFLSDNMFPVFLITFPSWRSIRFYSLMTICSLLFIPKNLFTFTLSCKLCSPLFLPYKLDHHYSLSDDIFTFIKACCFPILRFSLQNQHLHPPKYCRFPSRPIRLSVLSGYLSVMVLVDGCAYHGTKELGGDLSDGFLVSISHKNNQ